MPDILGAIAAEFDSIEARDNPADRPLVIVRLGQAQQVATETGVIDCRPRQPGAEFVPVPRAALDRWWRANSLAHRGGTFSPGGVSPSPGPREPRSGAERSARIARYWGRVGARPRVRVLDVAPPGAGARTARGHRLGLGRRRARLSTSSARCAPLGAGWRSARGAAYADGTRCTLGACGRGEHRPEILGPGCSQVALRCARGRATMTAWRSGSAADTGPSRSSRSSRSAAGTSGVAS